MKGKKDEPTEISYIEAIMFYYVVSVNEILLFQRNVFLEWKQQLVVKLLKLKGVFA